MSNSLFVLGIILAAAILILWIILSFIRPWLRAFFGGGVEIRIVHVIGMRLRGNPPMLIIDAYLKLLYSGKKMTIQAVESCYIVNKSSVSDADTLAMLVMQFEEESKKKKSN